MVELYGHDAYSPEQIAARIEGTGVVKARLPLVKMAALGVLAGGFIGLGAMFYTIVTADPFFGFALLRLLGGVVFSLGLILVVVAGGRISTRLLLRNFSVVFLANAAGAIGLAWLVSLSGPDEWIRSTAVKIATTKVSLGFAEAFFRGALCSVLVCLAVWLAMAGRSVTGKIVAIVLPIAAFVAAGFEHSIANLYFDPLGLFLGGDGLTWTAFLANNLLPVTLGNLLGGAGMVGLVYHVIYRRGPRGGGGGPP